MSTIPTTLKKAIEVACKQQKLDPAPVVSSVVDLVSDDNCIDFSVWSGPGYKQPTVVVDIYVLGDNALYNWTHHQEGYTATGSTFLEKIDHMTILSGLRAPSPVVLMYNWGPNNGMVFGKQEDEARLRAFVKRLAKARDARIKSKGGSG